MAEKTVERITCPNCNGTGNPRTVYDYARRTRTTQYCWRCDGDGELTVPTEAFFKKVKNET